MGYLLHRLAVIDAKRKQEREAWLIERLIFIILEAYNMINVELAQFDGGKNNAEMVVGVAMSVRDGLKQSEANVRGTDKCPYYYLKLEESLRELDPYTDPNCFLSLLTTM